MGPGFKRLRIGAIAGITGASLVPGVAGPAAAARTVGLPATHFSNHTTFSGVQYRNHADWAVANNAVSPGAATGYALADATRTLRTCNPACNAGTGTGDDMIDTFGLVTVNGAAYKDPDGHVDVEGNTFFSTPANVNGFRTSVRHTFLGFQNNSVAIMRTLVTLTNPSAKAKKRTVALGTMLHFGSATEVNASSTGDSVADSLDTWFGASRTAGTPTRVPGVMIVRGDSGKGTMTADPQGTGDASDRYTVTLRPHKTVRLLYFVALTYADAFGSAGPAYFTNGQSLYDSDLLQGMSEAERSQVVNWTHLPHPPMS